MKNFHLIQISSCLLLILICSSLCKANFRQSRKNQPERYVKVDRDGDDLEVRTHRKLFNRFIYDHDRYYVDELEKELRFSVFQQNMRKIDLLNKNELGTALYGITQFADLTDEEFSSKATGLRPELYRPKKNQNEKAMNIRVDLNAPLPESFDWRKKGGVTPPKNQGMCGSCWAFSTTGNIEGVHFAKTKQLVSLSEEQLVECDTLDSGCNGGLMSNAFQEVEKMGGLETEDDYPYRGVMAQKCHLNASLPKIDIDWYKELSKNETEIAAWLVQNGPVSIGINAFGMQFYTHGISHPWKFLCSPDKLDHGVLIVGYGVETKRSKKIPYWIVKNSWGKSWGEAGYYRVYRGAGVCGLNRMAATAGYN